MKHPPVPMPGAMPGHLPPEPIVETLGRVLRTSLVLSRGGGRVQFTIRGRGTCVLDCNTGGVREGVLAPLEKLPSDCLVTCTAATALELKQTAVRLKQGGDTAGALEALRVAEALEDEEAIAKRVAGETGTTRAVPLTPLAASTCTRHDSILAPDRGSLV